MSGLTSVEFTELARALAQAAREHGLDAPGFRSPPRLAVNRSIRRLGDGSKVVAVRIRGRAAEDVVADMVEGVIISNGLSDRAADGWRVALKMLSGFVDRAREAA